MSKKDDLPWTTYPVRQQKVEVGFKGMEFERLPDGTLWPAAPAFEVVKVLNPGWFDEGAGI